MTYHYFYPIPQATQTHPVWEGNTQGWERQTDYLPFQPGRLSVSFQDTPPFLLKLVCVFDLQQKEPRIRWNSESNALHFYP